LVGRKPAAPLGTDAGNAALAVQNGTGGNSDESEIGAATVALAAPMRNERRVIAGATMKDIANSS